MYISLHILLFSHSKPSQPSEITNNNMLSTRRLRIRMRTVEESSSSSSSSSSAEIIGSSDDLLSEILLRLPVKSLLKFKSISKHWLSLITHPHFSSRRSHNPTAASALFLRRPSPMAHPIFDFVPLHPSQTTAPFTSLTFTHLPRGIDIVQSCNGLLCCSSVGHDDSSRKYYIYNPTTKQFTTLPPLRRDSGAVRPVLGINLAFDPSDQSHVYKVVCVQRCESSRDQCQIQIYSSETGPWRLSGGPFQASTSVDFSAGVYWKGAVHWVSKREASLYFDLNEELVRITPMPAVPEGFDKRGIRYFGESLGHLHLVETYEEGTPTEFSVYEMERDRSGWFVKFRVDLEGVAAAFQDIVIADFIEEEDYSYCSFSVVCVVRGEEEEDSFLVIHVPGKMIGYNFISKSHWKICDVDCLLTFGWSYAFQYIESLSLV